MLYEVITKNRYTRLQGKKMGCGKDTFMAEQIQKTAYQMGKEDWELPRNATFRMRMDSYNFV